MRQRNNATSAVPDVLSSLLERYGLLIGGMDLARVLGYSSSRALSQSIYTGRCPVPVSKIPGRRGYYATADDIARFVAKLKDGERHTPAHGLSD